MSRREEGSPLPPRLMLVPQFWLLSSSNAEDLLWGVGGVERTSESSAGRPSASREEEEVISAREGPPC